HCNALATESHGAAVHLLPSEFDIPWIGTDQQRLQVSIDERLSDKRRQRSIAKAYKASVCKYLHQNPSMEREVTHRSLSITDKVHWVGTEVRRKWHRLALPLNNACANFGDLHRLAFIS